MNANTNGPQPVFPGNATFPGASAQQTAQPAYGPPSLTQGWFAVTDPGYVKGALLGAIVTVALTNAHVQRALVKGAVTLWTSLQGGIEEVKEQIQDIKSEMSMKSPDGAKSNDPEST